MPGQGAEDIASFGPFRLYARERRLERDGEPVRLGSRALEVLLALIERAGEVVSNEELTARVWPDTKVDEDNSLRVQIAGLRKALGHGQSGARYVTNVPGRGYAFVVPLSRRALAASPPRKERTGHLPTALERIVGRKADMVEMSNQLIDRRFVTVTGPGGMGKTTVTIAVAHQLSASFDGDVCFIDLSLLTDASQVVPTLAGSLGQVSPADASVDGLITFLRDRRLLVILDSCEHVLSAVAPVVERIVADTARAYVLATSREALRAHGEHVHRLAPLDSPARPEDITAHEALTFPAVQLFVDRATAGGAQLALTDHDAAVVATICRRLDGIALAIEIAAARVDAYGIDGVASLLDNRSKLLWQGRRTAVPRHRTLGADLDWSYNLLDDSERRVLRTLSCFVGPFSLGAAAAVASDEDLDAACAIQALGSLVEKSLVSMDVGGTAARYRLFDATRTYARKKLQEANEGQSIARRHAEYFCTLLEDDHGAEHLGNLRTALEWSFSEGGDRSLATRLAAASAPLFVALSLLTEYRKWVAAAMAVLGDGERGTILELRLQAGLGVASLFTQGDRPEVRTALRRGLTLAERVDDPQEQLRLLGALSLLLYRAAEYREALAVALRGEEVAGRLMDPSARLLVSWMIGACRHLIGDQVEAERRCRSALDPLPSSRLSATLQFGFDHHVRGQIVLAMALWLLGRADEAKSVALCAVREADASSQPTAVTMSRFGMQVFLWAGEWDTAELLIEKAIDCSFKHSLSPYYWLALGFKGRLAVTRRDPAGLDLLFRAVGALRAEGTEILSSVFATAIAEGLADLGRFEEALKTIDEAIAATTARNGSSFDMPEMLRIRGQLLAAISSPDQAEQCLLQSIACARQQQAIAWELRSAMTLGRLLATRDRAAEGRERLFAVYSQFGQGLETEDLVAARDLLAALDSTGMRRHEPTRLRLSR